MSFCVYGLRLKGDIEARYIGQTAYEPNTRLDRLTYEATMYGRKPTTGFGGWLFLNRDNIEAFKIAIVDSRKEAQATERTIIALCLQLNHRLFNSWLVPAERRHDFTPDDAQAAA